MVCNKPHYQIKKILVPQVALMVKYVSLEVAVRLRELWRCVTIRHGEWCLD